MSYWIRSPDEWISGPYVGVNVEVRCIPVTAAWQASSRVRWLRCFLPCGAAAYRNAKHGKRTTAAELEPQDCLEKARATGEKGAGRTTRAYRRRGASRHSSQYTSRHAKRLAYGRWHGLQSAYSFCGYRSGGLSGSKRIPRSGPPRERLRWLWGRSLVFALRNLAISQASLRLAHRPRASPDWRGWDEAPTSRRRVRAQYS